jgi:hypothetical protein
MGPGVRRDDVVRKPGHDGCDIFDTTGKSFSDYQKQGRLSSLGLRNIFKMFVAQQGKSLP